MRDADERSHFRALGVPSGNYDRYRRSSCGSIDHQLCTPGVENNQSRDTAGVSSTMYAVTVVGFLLWLLYGLKLHSWPLIVTNSICLAFSAFIFIMTLLPQDQKEAVADKIDTAI